MKIDYTKRTKDTLEAKAEVALMGRVVSVSKYDEVAYIIDYINKVLVAQGSISKPEATGEEVVKRLIDYDNKVRGLVVNTLLGYMPCITILLEDEEYDEQPPLDTDDGIFCYCFNALDDYMCSEFGCCFFEKLKDGSYHRIS